MRISEMIKIALEYFLVGSIILALVGIGYFIIYKKLLKGKKEFNMKTAALYAIFLIYIIIVLGATLGIRSQTVNTVNMHLFSSYIEAWNSFSKTEWRNIIFNILMFVPLGFLLPIVSRKFRSWWITYFIGLTSTIIVELIQLVSGKGIFELDDIINNTLGCIIGYGLVMICISYSMKKKNEFKSKAVIITCFQIPLCLTIMFFSVIFISYSKQELGNLSIACSYNQDMSKVNITSEVEFKDQSEEAYVYKATIGSKEDTLKIANGILGAVDSEVDESHNDVYDDTIIYRSKDEVYSVWVDYIGLTTNYTNSSTMSDSGLEGLGYREVKDLLKSFSISLPEEAEFIDVGAGKYEILVDMYNLGENILNGKLTCDIRKEREVSNFRNEIISYDRYKKYEIISEQEAYNEILQGNFKSYSVGNEIKIKDVQLTYKTDSKGFYQPVYEFSLEGTDKEQSILIPALKL
ncbi:MAG: VanZ family protein [Clostridium sp.]